MLNFRIVPLPDNINLKQKSWREDIENFLRNEAANENGVGLIGAYVISATDTKYITYDFFQTKKEAQDWISSALKMYMFKTSKDAEIFNFIK